MTVDTQDAGTGNNDAGAPQNAEGQKSDATGAADAAKADDKSGTESKTGDKPADGDVTYKFEAPEGIELDATQVGEFTTIAKELKLPAEAAQKIANLAIQREVKRAEAFREQVKKWGEEVGKDKELGTPETQAAARSVIDTYGTPELKTLLNSTGLGNHPELVRMVSKIGKALSEDAIRGKGGEGAKPSDPATILYGTPAAN